MRKPWAQPSNSATSALRLLLQRWGYVEVERVCSGIGITNIYEFLRDDEKIPERGETAEPIASSKDRAEAIVGVALNAGVNIDALGAKLQSEGADSFVKSWNGLMQVISSKTASLDKGATLEAVR